MAENTEAGRINVQLGVDGGAAGEMVTGEFHRWPVRGVAERAGEINAWFTRGAGRIQDEADGAGGDGAGILGCEFESQAADVGD